MKIAIIGAGAGGLAAAYDLTRADHSVTIFEAAGEVGGLAAGFKAPHWDWTIEKFYHHWFQSDKSIIRLIEELGWSDRVLFPRPFTVLYHEGQFYPSDSILTAFSFFMRHFPLPDFIRFGLVGLYIRLSPWWQPLEKVTAAEWMQRWCGERIYNAIWKPLLVGKFGEENLGVVNMAWLWARLHARTTRLGTFVGGFQAFMDKLAEVVKRQGAELRLNCGVTGIKKQAAGNGKRGPIVETAAGAEEFDAVISTSSPALMARLAPDLPAEYSEKLCALKSMGAVMVIIALDRRLTKHYWHNLPKEAGFPFLSLVEHTNFVGAEHFGGDHIIYCGDYLNPDHEYFRLSKEELLERFLPALTRFNPDFDRGWVKESWLFRTPYAQPIPPINHSRNIPPIRTPLRGLYFASMSQVYPWDRGTNYAVEIGREAARMVMEDQAHS
ncbi:MAG: NAD(P)/FAD-dependent oxidoreductase [Chloroflexi bacterium]|nr:NAD(P)/FAD-dependent oxidoreductase [Chloroflexota bacterium]